MDPILTVSTDPDIQSGLYRFPAKNIAEAKSPDTRSGLFASGFPEIAGGRVIEHVFYLSYDGHALVRR